MDNFLQKMWYQPNKLYYIFIPLSWIYIVIISLRKLLYKLGIKKTTRFPVPIIIIGNVTVGGTGKTPSLIAIANEFLKQKFRVGIVSRGYKSKAKRYPKLISNHDDAYEVGDEPLLIARHCDCPVVIDPNRVRAVKYLLEKFPCDVVLSDDGLQHLALGRDIEIVVIDGKRRFGNQQCLPAGPLREPLSRLKTVNYLITQGQAQHNEYDMFLQPTYFINLKNPQKKYAVLEFPYRKIHATTAIGNPHRFFHDLKEMNLDVISHAFPDHYFFSEQDFSQFTDDEIVIMTEKDAVKCQKFARDNFWYLEVEAIIDVALLQKLCAFITAT